jgi:hypothetical protein
VEVSVKKLVNPVAECFLEFCHEGKFYLPLPVSPGMLLLLHYMSLGCSSMCVNAKRLEKHAICDPGYQTLKIGYGFGTGFVKLAAC